MIEIVTLLFGGIGTFLGSATLRWLLGEGLGMFKARQDRRSEMDLADAELKREDTRRGWRKEELTHAHNLGLARVEVEVKAQERVDLSEGILRTVEAVNRLTGIGWVDNVNHGIRPLLAITAIALLILEAFKVVALTSMLSELAQSVLGLYVGGRINNTGR